jgi:hypothetical protein
LVVGLISVAETSFVSFAEFRVGVIFSKLLCAKFQDGIYWLCLFHSFPELVLFSPTGWEERKPRAG